MVGVPGRSKACNTCRRRKKGCDLQRPACGQCRKACIECTGYSREYMFVNGTVQTSFHRPSRETTVALHNGLARSAYENKYLELFWETYLPNGRELSGDAIWATGAGWTNAIQGLYDTEDVLRTAFLSMCLATIGRRYGQTWMSEQSLRLYGTALQKMSMALSVPSKAKGDAVLVVSKLFSLYEAMHGADDAGTVAQRKSWLAHNSGETAIIASRAPEQYTTGHSHRLFVDGRLHLIVSALLVRKKTIFSDVEWMTIPWRQQSKTSMDTLLDIFIDVPELFEDIDAMEACSDSDLRDSRRHELIEVCWVLDRRLEEWHTAVRPPTALDQVDFGNPNYIKTEDLSAIHLTVLHWAICLVLYQTLSELVDKETRLPERANSRLYFQKIARTVPVFLHPAVGTFRMHLATFPIGAALRFLATLESDDMTAERKLLGSYLTRSEATMIGKFVTKFVDNKEADVLDDHIEW